MRSEVLASALCSTQYPPMLAWHDLLFDLALLPQSDLFASLLLVTTLWIARRAALSAIRTRSGRPLPKQRRLIAASRTLFLFLAPPCLVLIWAPQLNLTNKQS